MGIKKNISDFENSDLYEDEEDDLELLDNDDFKDVDNVNIDENYITSLTDKISKNELLTAFLVQEKSEATTSLNKKSQTHPIDSYLRDLILDVLVKEFMPLLEKKLNSLNKK